jgi:hypothetical protein
MFLAESTKREAPKNAEQIGFSARDRRGPLPYPGPTDRTVRESDEWAAIARDLRDLNASATAQLDKSRAFIAESRQLLTETRELIVGARELIVGTRDLIAESRDLIAKRRVLINHLRVLPPESLDKAANLGGGPG